MDNTSDRRDKAIRAYNDRTDAANRKIAEREAHLRAQELRRQQLFENWPKLADGLIADTVKAVNSDYSKHGSPVLLNLMALSAGSAPQRQSDKSMQGRSDSAPRVYDIRHGQSPSLGRLQFEIDISTGKISAATTVKNAVLPPPILIDDFDPKWVAAAAEAMLLAVLEGE